MDFHEYIASQPEAAQSVLERVRAAIRKTVPRVLTSSEPWYARLQAE
jgi:hypothetical protein